MQQKIDTFITAAICPSWLLSSTNQKHSLITHGNGHQYQLQSHLKEMHCQ